VSYISTLGGARWENWRADYVIVIAEANDRLVLPSNGPTLDCKLWRTQPSLSPELLTVLDRIETLVTGGLTSMHVVGEFLKHQVTSLQQRPRLSYWLTGPNDICRIQHGPGTDLSWEELELLVKGITGESFISESMILPRASRRSDPALRTVMLASLPTLDESGVALRQTGGWDPHRRIRISGAPTRGPQPAGVAPSAPAGASSASAAAPAPWIRARGLQVASPPEAAPGCQRKRGDAGCAASTGRLFRTPPVGPRRPAPRSIRGPLVGPRRPAPRPRACRGASALRHHNHWVRRHHNHHHRQVRRRSHHPGRSPPGAPAAATTTVAATTAATAKEAVARFQGHWKVQGPK
jgi:hypothetical protein